MHARVLCLALIFTGPTSAADRRIEREVVVPVMQHSVWRAWTTEAGLKSLFLQGAKVELKPGGAYEWYFNMAAPEGSRGGEGCKVLAYVPQELLVFSWNAPPSLPALRASGAKTQVFVRFDALDGGQSKIRLTHLITEQGPDWDKYVEYFEKAWTSVLAKCQEKFKADARAIDDPAPVAGPPLVQSVDVDAPAATLWKAITDPAIAKKWMAPNVELEIKLGGKFRANYDPNAAADADSWINREVIAVDPGRLLVVKMLTAPAKFPHKEAIEKTWHTFDIVPLGANKSRLRLLMAGMTDDDASRTMRGYFEKANPTVLAKLKAVVEAKP